MIESETIRQLYNFSQIPIQIFEDKIRTVNFGDLGMMGTFISNYLQIYSDSQIQCGYGQIYDYILCGFLKKADSQSYMIIGPTVSKRCSHEVAAKITEALKLPNNETSKVIEYFNNLHFITEHQFIAFIKVIGQIINQDQVNVFVDEPKLLTIATKQIKTHGESFELSFISHNQNSIEKDLMTYIEFGKVAELELKIQQVFSYYGPDTKIPRFEGDEASAIHQIMANAISISARAALRGGVAYDVSMSMADFYMHETSKLQSKEGLEKLFVKMLLDFAKKSAAVNKSRYQSGLASKVNKEIQSYLYEKITPTRIAKNLNMNLTYICRKFKEDTGETISDHINNMKIQEAKRLLLVTDTAIIDIAIQLGFTSRSYFNRVFKKWAHDTPLSYRQHHDLEENL